MLTSQKEYSDEKLIALFKIDANNDAISEIFKRYNPLLLGLCFKYFKNLSQAEDSVMEIFESVLQKVKDHEITHFRSWLYVLAKNHCLMKLRKNEKLIYSDSIIMEFSDSEHLYRNNELEGQLIKLENCISKLNNEQKAIVSSFFLEKMSYSLIAEKFQITQKKVKSYIQNGKRNLKICMQSDK